MVNIPGQALECRLAQLQPSSIRNSKGLWDEEVVARFTDLVTRGGAEGRLTAKIFSVHLKDLLLTKKIQNLVKKLANAI